MTPLFYRSGKFDLERSKPVSERRIVRQKTSTMEQSNKNNKQNKP